MTRIDTAFPTPSLLQQEAPGAGSVQADYERDESSSSRVQLQAGTYNLAAGNDNHRKNFDVTSQTLAEQVTSGGVDVVALQEVDVGTDRSKQENDSPDYNLTVLGDIAAAEQGLGEVESHEYYSLDAEGNRVAFDPSRYSTTVVEAKDADGNKAEVTVNAEYYVTSSDDLDQTLSPATADDKTITVYSAQVQAADGKTKDYTIAYGSSVGVEGGTYGNAVLLGPEASLQRDARGIPEITRQDLGANDQGGENRTALAVGIESQGEQATVVSAHLTVDPRKADGKPDKKAGDQIRAKQYDTLAKMAVVHGDNTILLGDFNSRDRDTVGSLSGDNNNLIDRGYVGSDFEADNRQVVEGGGSDHEMVTWNIYLDA